MKEQKQQQQPQQPQPKDKKKNIYEIQLSGIKCMGCANKINKNLGVMAGVNSINVNILAQKVQVVLDEALDVNKVTQKLVSLSFEVLQKPQDLTSNNHKSGMRQISFCFKIENQQDQKKLEALQSKLTELYEINEISMNDDYLSQDKYEKQVKTKNLQKLLTIQYNPLFIKGRDIQEKYIETSELQFQVVNDYLSNFSCKQSLNFELTFKDLILSMFVTGFFVIMSMILPRFAFFEPFITMPITFGIFSAYGDVMILLSLVAIAKYGFPFYKRAFHNFFFFRSLDMESLVSLGSCASFIMAAFQIIASLTFQKTNDIVALRMQILDIIDMLETAALIVCIISIGRYFEIKAKNSIIKMTEEIFPQGKLFASTIAKFISIKNRKFEIQKQKNFEVSLIEVDDLIEIKQDDQLLVDGIVINGQVTIIDSLVYGSDIPVIAKKGDRIKSGAEIVEGEAILQVEKTIEKSMFYEIGKQLNITQSNSQMAESGISATCKRIAENFVKFVLVVALITWITWLVLTLTKTVKFPNNYQHITYPFIRAISVLVASCPCALGLAIPSVIAISLNIAMKLGVLIKKNNLFEELNKVKCIFFDKTGTLFTRVEQISGSKYFDQLFTEDEVWQIIQIVEKNLTHPLATILYKESLKKINIGSEEDMKFIISEQPVTSQNGIMAQVIHKATQKIIPIFIGNKHLLQKNAAQLPENLLKEVEQYEKSGKTVLVVIINKQVAMLINFDNKSNLRPEAYEVVQYLQNNQKKEIYILSGDAMDTVISLGQYLNIPQQNLIGEVSAETKMNTLQRIKSLGKKSMMIGDGLNDILSLQAANVGVSINAKSELNLLASDVIILNENLWKVPSLIRLIRLANIFIWINLFWAFIYNLFMIPVSAGMLYGYNFTVSPLVSSAAMAGSSVVVVLCSNIMRFYYSELTHERNDLKHITRVFNTPSNSLKGSHIVNISDTQSGSNILKQEDSLKQHLLDKQQLNLELGQPSDNIKTNKQLQESQ